jgi:ComF family protein
VLCAVCLKNIPHASKPQERSLCALFAYRAPIMKKAIWRFKYNNTREFASIFAPIFADEIMETLSDRLHVSCAEKPLLAPIPLHKKRFHERGYNQSELLTQAIMTYENGSVFEYAPYALARMRATKPQARNDNKKTRLENLRGAFMVPVADHIRGRVIVLIDDVTTTGATLSEARKTLLAAGARDVIAFALAH